MSASSHWQPPADAAANLLLLLLVVVHDDVQVCKEYNIMIGRSHCVVLIPGNT